MRVMPDGEPDRPLGIAMVFRRAFGATALLCLLAAHPAVAATVMTTGGQVLRPFGHAAFCAEAPAACAPRDTASDRGPARLDAETMRLVARINLETNTRIRPASDRELYGVEERWAFPDAGRGDCEDYALEKQRRLVAAGLAPSNLLLTVVRKRDGTGHAVLTLRAAQGDFVLDNLDWRVLPWRETPYRFIKRQHPTQPAVWVGIEEKSADPVVSAVRK